MIVRSAMVRDGHVVPIEIEIVLAPGLPTIEFLGRPEPTLRESAARIRAALRACGHSMPKGRKILVDLRPRLERKHGVGLDLPVAIGFLVINGDVPREIIRDHVIYGDLSLEGEVLAPPDWSQVCRRMESLVLTGLDREPSKAKPATRAVGERAPAVLKSLRTPFAISVPDRELAKPADAEAVSLARNSGLKTATIRLQEDVARLAAVSSLGEHSLLMAGPAGTGKTTLAKVIHELRPEPDASEQIEIAHWSPVRSGRPFVCEHHSANEVAMVGGGMPPRPGAVTRANFGTLVLDEALLFRPQVQDALREPTEERSVSLARGPFSERFPCRYLLLGTTNLCACGAFTEERPELCRCSRATLRQYAARRRGPFIDRFQMLVFTSRWSPGLGRVGFSEIQEQVASGLEFRRARTGQSGEFVVSDAGAKEVCLGAAVDYETVSERRRLAVFGVARTVADLDREAEVLPRHVAEAKRYALDVFTVWSAGGA